MIVEPLVTGDTFPHFLEIVILLKTMEYDVGQCGTLSTHIINA